MLRCTPAIILCSCSLNLLCACAPDWVTVREAVAAVSARGAWEAVPAVVADVSLRVALGVASAAVTIAAAELAEAVGVGQAVPWHSVSAEL